MSLYSLLNISSTSLSDYGAGTRKISPWYVSYVVTAILFMILVYSTRESYPDLPRLNPKQPTEFTTAKRRAEFLSSSQELLAQGTQKFKDKPYKIYTENGDRLILPPKYVDELRSNPKLTFKDAAGDDSHNYVPGFEPFMGPVSLVKVVTNNLTRTLLSLTAPISAEAAEGLRDVFTDSEDWHEITPRSVMLVVSRMSSRIFMGKELCNDIEWIRASSEYVSSVFECRYRLSSWPRSMRSIVHWFLPGFAEMRRKLQHCRDVLQPHIDRRNAIKKQALARGEKNPFNDSIEWFEKQEPGTAQDPAANQINLSLVAIHTTSDLLTQTMVDIAKHPKLFALLREEVVQVLREDGLKKTAFYKLKLMDSCFKESQRLRPILNTYFQRLAHDNIQLSDGFTIKKGTIVAMDGHSPLISPDSYEDPLQYNPYRFMKMREDPSEESRAHLVSVSPQHFGFGHGLHACPGRFFAANEVKIALAHILLKYDWKLAEGCADLKPLAIGTILTGNPAVKLVVRRRTEELDLDSLEC